MEKIINYNKLFIDEIENIKKLDNKPKLLLHTCCGPCFTIPFERLKEYFDITLIFNNSNIYPKYEYDRRKEELLKFLEQVAPNIKVIQYDYDNDKFNLSLEPYANQKEGQDRCKICFRKRLREGFEFAKENDFDYFGTVMTISRYKNAQIINQIGKELEDEFKPVKWLFADFKKNNGYEDSLLIIKKFNMYLQQYCGCKYSFQKFLAKQKK